MRKGIERSESGKGCAEYGKAAVYWKRAAVLLFYAIFLIVGFAAFAARPVIDWTKENFGVSVQEILFTIKSPMKGADMAFLKGAVLAVRGNILFFCGFFLAMAFSDRYIFRRMRICLRVKLKEWHAVSLRPLCYLAVMAAAVWALFLDYLYLDEVLGISEYLEARSQRTELYENYYVDPLEVEISASGKTKNLIYIYLESMETTYASKEAGGYQEVNYIPRLTAIARENLSFSDGSLLGGWHETFGNGWTIGALFSTTTGIPLSYPVSTNEMGNRSTFAAGVTNLGDILEKQGYVQEFLCGSDGSFAGRADYFTQHGNYKIFDYYQAILKEYIPEDYSVWWGFEDSILYDIARDELTELAAAGDPFNFTMLTVDTHHVDGYICASCGDKYPEQLANVLACADSMVYEFVEWCKKQDFYKDTVIVITGDHPRMDTSLVAGVKKYDRTVYNAFLNAREEDLESARTLEREFSAMDMFPTVLGAMGFSIEGDRLGLGTNLFSERDTLMEELGGFENLNEELKKYSNYYDRHFY